VDFEEFVDDTRNIHQPIDLTVRRNHSGWQGGHLIELGDIYDVRADVMCLCACQAHCFIERCLIDVDGSDACTSPYQLEGDLAGHAVAGSRDHDDFSVCIHTRFLSA
jgi:hypothetical protein